MGMRDGMMTDKWLEKD